MKLFEFVERRRSETNSQANEYEAIANYVMKPQVYYKLIVNGKKNT